ncbi:STAS domain-containing protein [Mycobacterium sp. NPDC051804]|uniref:STAS domain-containing protein n=1 Tax=Mycobacterium sp. NPDC051804 TaxID=3364295 RepID=UPI0037983DC6
MALLEVTQDVRDAAVVVSAVGDVDSESVASLKFHLDTALKRALDHPARLLVIDLSGVTHFGSAGLNSVLECHEHGQSAGATVRIAAPNPEVLRPIQVTKLDRVLLLYPSVPAALEGN